MKASIEPGRRGLDGWAGLHFKASQALTKSKTTGSSGRSTAPEVRSSTLSGLEA